MARNKLWGSTRYGPHEIKIYINPRMSLALDGYTRRRKGGVVVEINKELLADPARFDETLIHELIHVLEYLHSPEAFDPKEVNHCCAMVQTISKGLAQMLRELRQVGT